MSLIKKITTIATIMSMVLSNITFAQGKNSQQKATDAITTELLHLKNQGGKLEDEQGNEISAAQLVSGQVRSVIYTPAYGRKLKYHYRSNQVNQNVTLAVLKSDGTRIATRSFGIDTSVSPEQNVLIMRQTMSSLQSEVDQYVDVASNGSKSLNRMPASNILDPMLILNSLFLGANVFYCAKDPKKSALSCATAAFMAILILITIAD